MSKNIQNMYALSDPLAFNNEIMVSHDNASRLQSTKSK